MMYRHYLAATAVALMSVAVCSGGIITALNPYTFTSVCEGVSSPTNAGCSVTNASSTGNVQYGLNSATGPFVTASNSSTNGSGNTNGNLEYQFLVTGPGNTVQVDANYLLSVSDSFSPLGNDQSAQFTTSASFGLIGLPIANVSGNFLATGGSSENGFPPRIETNNLVNATYSAQTRTVAGSVSGPQTFTLTTGLAYTVEMRLQANCYAGMGVGCTTSALIDPTFTVNPNQANAGQYSIAFSPGVGNGTPGAVPEPASFLLLGGGLLGICVRVRQSKVNRSA